MSEASDSAEGRKILKSFPKHFSTPATVHSSEPVRRFEVAIRQNATVNVTTLHIASHPLHMFRLIEE
ncbi:hypothetical protein Y032_0574g178 [Ancylostoma ceylanicum]|uniref:Uncharacterized protein n=1 Tax=Ancylostoma ceylanicum TaxID=53326 RepID=A0A016WNQ1_9BILA|nr:hypothetical protein Y032_0574g178 [Ancylostoma ceylanicum]